MSEPEKRGSPWPWILVPVGAFSLFFVLRECRKSLPPATHAAEVAPAPAATAPATSDNPAPAEPAAPADAAPAEPAPPPTPPQ